MNNITEMKGNENANQFNKKLGYPPLKWHTKQCVLGGI